VQNIVDDGGEGVILRKFASEYENGRTTSLIKLKVHDNSLLLNQLISMKNSAGDTEAIVAGVTEQAIQLKLYIYGNGRRDSQSSYHYFIIDLMEKYLMYLPKMYKSQSWQLEMWCPLVTRPIHDEMYP
jgi:hypothetical protein